MPNIKSAKKRVVVTEKKNSQNKMIRSAVKTAIKKFNAALAAGDAEAAEKLLPETVSVIDSAASKGILHKNNAANKKSALAKNLNALKAAPKAAPAVEVEEVKVEAVAAEAPVARVGLIYDFPAAVGGAVVDKEHPAVGGREAAPGQPGQAAAQGVYSNRQHLFLIVAGHYYKISFHFYLRGGISYLHYDTNARGNQYRPPITALFTKI